MENAGSGTPVASQGAMKAFFDQWRQNKRAQQQNETDSPTKTASSPRVEGESPSKTGSAVKVAEQTSTSETVSRGSPVSARMTAKTAQVVEGAGAPTGVTTSALKLIRQVETSSSKFSMFRCYRASSVASRGPSLINCPTGPTENATRDNDDATPSKKRRRDDTDTEPEDSYPVRDQIVAEADEWDPPFTTPPRHSRPTATPNSSRRRGPAPRGSTGARRSSPIVNTQDTQDQEQDEEKGQENEANDAEKEEPETAKSEQPREKRYSFKSIEAHRPSPDEPELFELLVHWANAADGPSETWEAEVDLHYDAPRSLFSYWRAVGGREAHMKDPGLWYVAGIKSHRVTGGKVTMLVSWVGSGDNNWEPEDKLQEVAPEVLEEYWQAKGGREKCVGKSVKKPGAGRKGRPRKVRKT